MILWKKHRPEVVLNETTAFLFCHPVVGLSLGVSQSFSDYPYDNGENHGADNGPDNRKGLSLDMDDKNRGECEFYRKPFTYQGSYEPYYDGYQASAQGIPCDCLSYTAADGGDDQQNDEAT
jgi:hypothetical protein